MSEVTRILSAIDRGDPRAAEQLLPLVYDELRKLAAQKLACETPGQTLEAPARCPSPTTSAAVTTPASTWAATRTQAAGECSRTPPGAAPLAVYHKIPGALLGTWGFSLSGTISF
jgi:hypothetical protein